MNNDPIYVTRPSLPDFDEFVASLRSIWQSRQLTNVGPFHEALEHALAEYLGVEHVSLFCNGTIALQVGLQALRIAGEVITTPYSFPATTHVIYWNRCKPVFCDIDSATCNLDVSKIESLITPRTTAIVPVHVYGTPCDTDAIARIADTYGLRVIYDAAHAFGARWRGRSLVDYGDLAMLSFHATKIFSTIEGGALVTRNAQLKKRIDYLKNFGIAGETRVVAPGTNGKLNELQAAYGLLQLKQVDGNIAKCARIAARYRALLADVRGLRMLHARDEYTPNHSYFPVFVDAVDFGLSRDDLYQALRNANIMTRRYFYPLISSFASYRNLPSAKRDNLPVAEAVCESVLCLPMYPDLDERTIGRICGVIRDAAGAPKPAA